jgi:hypothetical protein
MFLIFGWSRFGGAPKEHMNIDKTYHTIDAMGPETELVVAAFSISFHIYIP